jgi:hypothetical protein
MSLPYHQAAIRELDRPPVTGYDDRGTKARYMAVCEGSRPFTRYSYGDLLREGRPYGVVYRIWPGTQRVLLWGDPAMAAGFSRAASLAGSQGLEWCEPLSLKGREGTGVPGGRSGYADDSLRPAQDWHKHAYSYRLFGRLLYNPDAPSETWRRALRNDFGAAAESAEAALASASRILPLVTSAHHPSASNNYYWPEVYTDIGIVSGPRTAETHYYDTPVPKRFGTVGPLDPEIFSSVQECVEEADAKLPSGRLSPWSVAERLETLATEAAAQAAEALEECETPGSPDVRRLLVDVGILAALGRFFGSKLRSAVYYEVASRTGSTACLRDAVTAYRSAHSAWTDAVRTADGVYVDNLTYGPQPWLRGTWSDRLAAIDADLEAMESATAGGTATGDADSAALRILAAIMAGTSGHATHIPPAPFRPGEPVTVAVKVGGDVEISRVSLRYRHLDQSATYEEVAMGRNGDGFSAAVPAAYADSPFALQYHFVIRDTDGGSWHYPGLGPELSDQPYFVVRQREECRSRADGLPPSTS